MNTENQKETIKTIETTFMIVQALQDLNGAGVTEIANYIEMSKGTVSKHLSTLLEEEYVVRNEDEYRLGLRFLDYGGHAQTNIGYSQVITEGVIKLALRTDEVVWFLAEDYGKAVYVDRAMTENALRMESRIGERSHMHYLAGGKAIMAQMSDERVNEIIDRHGLPRRTEQTITDPDELLAELESVRNRGVAFNDEEEIENVRAVGVPIEFEGKTVGALTVGGPASRLNGDRFTEELPNVLLEVEDEIELKVSFGKNQP